MREAAAHEHQQSGAQQDEKETRSRVICISECDESLTTASRFGASLAT